LELNIVSVLVRTPRSFVDISGGECYCGNSLNAGSVLANTGDCSMTCDGNALEYCGGPNRLDLYKKGASSTSTTAAGGASGTTTAPAASTTTPSGPQHEAKVGAYTWAGCYTEATNERALTGNSEVNYNTMTVEICAAFCASYTIFGVEYGKCLSSNSEKLC
jgi:hypothetical protein